MNIGGIRGRAAAAVMLAGLLVGCSGGEDAEDGTTERDPVTLEDLRPEGAEPAEFTPPSVDDVSAKWRPVAERITTDLAAVLERSFVDESLWEERSDLDASLAVMSALSGIDRADIAAATEQLVESRAEDGLDGERHNLDSLSAFEQSPEDHTVYKVAFDVAETEAGLEVRANAWVGYDLGEDAPAVLMREVTMTAEGSPEDDKYNVKLPLALTLVDSCPRDVEGVIRPPRDGLGSETVEDLRTVFAEPGFVDMDATIEMIGEERDALSEESRERAATCLEEAEGTS